MELTKFQDYKFTENTEALVNDKWFPILGYAINTYSHDEDHNQVFLKNDNIFSPLSYANIQQLREKPSELIVDVDKSGKVTIWNSYAQSENFQEFLQYRFKAVECEYDTWESCDEWRFSKYPNNDYYVRNIKLRIDYKNEGYTYHNKDGKYYILDPLYEAPEEVKVVEPKFKIGDMVRVKAKENCQDKSPYLIWHVVMSDYCRTYSKIRLITENGNMLLENSNYIWHPDWLELVVEPELQEISETNYDALCFEVQSEAINQLKADVMELQESVNILIRRAK